MFFIIIEKGYEKSSTQSVYILCRHHEDCVTVSERKYAADIFYVEANMWLLLKTFQCFLMNVLLLLKRYQCATASEIY